MSSIIHLTDKPIKISGASDVIQDLRLALDVLGYDELDLMLHVQRLDGTSPVLAVTLETSMQNESEDDGWVTATTFTNVTSANTAEVKNVTQFLRYLRWSITLGGTSPVATFTVQGMGRRWA
jgi:hypothetical protein